MSERKKRTAQTGEKVGGSERSQRNEAGKERDIR